MISNNEDIQIILLKTISHAKKTFKRLHEAKTELSMIAGLEAEEKDVIFHFDSKHKYKSTEMVLVNLYKDTESELKSTDNNWGKLRIFLFRILFELKDYNNLLVYFQNQYDIY
ncbi:unnamed protein product [Gordionus sp. m RMFG-2023]